MENYLRWVVAGAIVIAAVCVGYSLAPSTEKPVGSIETGQEYNATSTGATATLVGITGDAKLKTGSGALGSVIITGANTGYVSFLDATTTDITKRGSKATSTITIATLPINAAAGTYVFDAAFTAGLMIELDNGIMPTTTVTWR